jgi:hypothetical protein
MTTSDGASSTLLDQGDPGEKRQPPPFWSRRKTVVAILLGGSVCAAGWWWSHPSAFGGVGGEFGARPDRLTSVYVDMAGVPEDGQVTIINATPRVQVFGGEAQTDVLLCDGANIGILYGEQIERQCNSPLGVQREDNSWDQIVLKVTPVHAGTVLVVDGMDLTYSTSWQRGTEHTGWTGTIVFPTE